MPAYSDEVLRGASKAAFGIAKWVRAMIQYDEAMKIVRPKREQLKFAQESSKEAQRIWDEALARLREVEEQMKKLMDEFEEAKAEEENLRLKKEDYEKKVYRADQLIDKLSGERQTWKLECTKMIQFRENIVGDILISSGIIAYLGVFTM